VVHVVTRYLRGGSEKRIGDMIRALPEAEHHVIVGRGSDVALAERELPDALIVPVRSFVREVHPLGDARTLVGLVAVIRAVDPDLVVTHQSKGGVLGRVAAWATGRPSVHSLSMASFGPGYRSWEDRVFRLVERSLAPVTSRFAASGDDLRQRFISLGVPGNKIRVVRSGVRLPGVADRAGAIHEESVRERPTLLYLGSLDERKNVLALVPFLEGVIATASVRPRLVVAGEGPLSSALAARVRAAGLEADVEMLGFVTNPYAHIRSATSMVLLSHAEGLPQVLVQAAAVGTPFVSYDVDGARELIALGARGLVVPMDDLDGAVVAAGKTLSEPRRATPIDVSPWLPERILWEHRSVLLEALGIPVRRTDRVVA
jgi:glycosyltransferase involved in cell wall biosynthesis